MSTVLKFTDIPEDKSVEEYAEELNQKHIQDNDNLLKEEQKKLDDMTKNSNGGTEQMLRGLKERVDPDLLDKFQIICSRVRWVDPDKKAILWLHDLPNDPESQHLKDKRSRERFSKFVCVSNWQMQAYNMSLGLPYQDSMVLQNAIQPVNINKKEIGDQIRLIYHTTPHRGLELLVPVYDQLYKEFGDKIHLDVYSSFALYGWDQRDDPYKEVFDKCRDHEGITYHGYQPHDIVIEALKSSHIFAYPSVWLETSCLSAIEAMSAKCSVVAPNYGALPETLASFGYSYQWAEDSNEHAKRFAGALKTCINSYLDENTRKSTSTLVDAQKKYIDSIYNWDLRAEQWTEMLKSLL